MISDMKRIHITSESELAPLLEAAGEHPILLEKDGEIYRLSKETRSLLSEKALAAFRSAAGGWADVDTEHLKKTIYISRQLRTRPPVNL